MESERLYPLAAEQWQAVEQLSDALAATADLRQAFEIAIDILLAAGKRPAAALYLPRFCEHITVDWTVRCIPPAWQAALNSGAGPLIDITNQVMRSGEPAPADLALGLGAAIPIRANQHTYGVLLICEPAVPVENFALWQALLRPFARAAALHAAVSGNANGAPAYIDLLKSRNTLRAMFDSLPIAIYIIGSGYRLVAVNENRAGRTGERPNHLVGGTCYEKLYHRSEPCQNCRAGDTLVSGVSTSRLNREWLDGERFIEREISTFPIADEQDSVIQAIVIEEDVTDKRNLEANLIQSEKLAAVGQLAAGVAHEINNPLTAILANAQILARELPPDAVDMIDSVKLIEMAGTRASQVVRNLLGIARKEKYEFEPIDLNETLHNALSLVQHELVGRPVQVYLNLSDDMPRIHASQDQLQGVWINLILNAIDAIDKANGQISIVALHTGSEFQVSITDNGKGIPADMLPRVFEPFFTTKSPGRGTGLGLSVCQRAIRHHGGNIVVESQPGKWTRFTVLLPGGETDD